MSSTSVNDLIMEVLKSANTHQEKLQQIDEIRKARPPLEDRWLYRPVVWALCVIAISTVLLGFYLVLHSDKSLPEGALAIGSTAIGALAALITPKQHQSDGD